MDEITVGLRVPVTSTLIGDTVVFATPVPAAVTVSSAPAPVPLTTLFVLDGKAGCEMLLCTVGDDTGLPRLVGE